MTIVTLILTRLIRTREAVVEAAHRIPLRHERRTDRTAPLRHGSRAVMSRHGTKSTAARVGISRRRGNGGTTRALRLPMLPYNRGARCGRDAGFAVPIEPFIQQRVVADGGCGVRVEAYEARARRLRCSSIYTRAWDESMNIIS